MNLSPSMPARALCLIALLLAAPAARAIEVKVSLGGGEAIGPQADRGGFTLDCSLGWRIPNDWWNGPVFVIPQVGGTFDFYGSVSEARWFYAGATLAGNVVSEVLTIGYQAAWVSDFDRHGLRNALRLGLFYDMVILEGQYDLVFAPGGEIHVFRGLVGVDFASVGMLLMRIAMGSL